MTDTPKNDFAATVLEQNAVPAKGLGALIQEVDAAEMPEFALTMDGEY